MEKASRPDYEEMRFLKDVCYFRLWDAMTGWNDLLRESGAYGSYDSYGVLLQTNELLNWTLLGFLWFLILGMQRSDLGYELELRPFLSYSYAPIA